MRGFWRRMGSMQGCIEVSFHSNPYAMFSRHHHKWKRGYCEPSGGCTQNAKKQAFWRWYGQRSKCAVLQWGFETFTVTILVFWCGSNSFWCLLQWLYERIFNRLIAGMFWQRTLSESFFWINTSGRGKKPMNGKERFWKCSK